MEAGTQKEGADSKSSNPVFGWLVLIAALGGLWYVAEPLVPTGPGREFSAPPGLEGGKVPARLWQDPLGVVRGAGAGETLLNDASPGELRPSDLVLPVTVPGGYSAEIHEDRLRIRYAVLTALSVAGYVPLQTESLSYYRVPDHPLPLIPYEWLESDRLRAANDSLEPSRVLVLWLESEPLTENLVSQLWQLLAPLNWQTARPRIRVVGPAWSDDLRRILASDGLELLRTAFGNDVDGFPAVRIYSPRATAANGILRTVCPDCNFNVLSSDWSADKPIVRTIASDRKLADALVAELINRNIITKNSGDDEGAEIAILAEWDSSYGRGFPLTFAFSFQQALGKLRGDQPGNFTERAPDFKWPAQLLRVIYMRGLEGTVPGGAGESDGDSSLERAEGTRRFDYVRRLADLLALEGRKIKAIGVVGSDVYDKLLLLQALRPRFPHAVFFATDLDARLLHRDVNEWTRNLIVASSFGLHIDEELLAAEIGRAGQRQPPFRDSYQTAVFLSTLLALEKVSLDTVEQAARPKLYEIGRSGAIRLSEGRLSPSWSKAGLWIAFLLSAAGLLLLLNALRSPSFWREAEWKRCARCYLYFAAATILVLAVVLFNIFRDSHPEPFAWLEGISVWPTELLRLLTAILAFYFLTRAASRIRRSNEWLPRVFDSLESKGGLPVAESKEPAAFFRQCCHDFVSYLRVDWTEGQEDVQNLWRRYQLWGQPRRRWARVVPALVVYVIAAACIFGIFGIPEIPARGWSSHFADVLALFVSVGLQLALIFYVIDAILLCRRFVTRLSDPEIRWPEKTEPDSESLGAWFRAVELKVELIALRTEAVGTLIYYPFLVLPIMIVSRLSYFDRWDWPLSLVLVVGANAVLAIVAALFLRRSAEEARLDIVSSLRQKRLELTKPTEEQNKNWLPRIEKALVEIAGERRGAFAPITQNPIVGAVLLPSGTMGLAFALEFLGTAT